MCDPQDLEIAKAASQWKFAECLANEKKSKMLEPEIYEPKRSLGFQDYGLAD